MDKPTLTIQEARQELHETIRKEIPYAEKAREALELGNRFLGTDNGYLTRTDKETNILEIVISTEEGTGKEHDVEYVLREQYCHAAIKNGSLLAIHNAAEQGWVNDPAYDPQEQTYLGTPLIIDDDPYGTVCFKAEEAREEPFSEEEKRFAEYLTLLLEHELEREQIEAQLTSQTNVATVLNRVLRHNLRNDISVIRGFTELIAKDVEDEEITETIFDHIDAVIQLAEKARELERVVSASSERKHTEIGALIEEIAETVSQEYHSASISVEYDEEIWMGVLQNFDRAIEELIENAAKHSGENATVTVSIEPASNVVEIRITDDGPGLPDPEVEVITQGELTPLIHGSGLGLWLAHWIIANHDGSLEPRVSEDGTTLTVTIPRQPPLDVKEQLTELTRSRDKYKATFEQANDAMVITDDDGRYIDANDSAAELFRIPVQELLGRSLDEFATDDIDFGEVWSQFQASKEQGNFPIERPNGSKRYVEYSATADIIPGHHLSILRDVTDRKEREQELQRTNKRFERAQAVGEVGWWQKDIPSDDITWSEQVYEMWGAEGDISSIDHETFLDFIHPEDAAYVDEQWEAAKNGQPYDIEHRIITGDGDVKWMREQAELTFNDDGEPVSAIGIVQDITELKEREQKISDLNRRLRNEKERYESLFTSIRDPILVADTDRNIINCNPAFEDQFGYNLDEIEGKHTKYVYESDAEYEAMGEAIEGHMEDREFTYTVTYEKKSGETFPGETNVFYLRNAEGEIDGFIGVIKDITEEKN